MEQKPRKVDWWFDVTMVLGIFLIVGMVGTSFYASYKERQESRMSQAKKAG